MNQEFWSDFLAVSAVIHLTGMLLRFAYHAAHKVISRRYPFALYYLGIDSYCGMRFNIFRAITRVFLWELWIFTDGASYIGVAIFCCLDESLTRCEWYDWGEFIKDERSGSIHVVVCQKRISQCLI